MKDLRMGQVYRMAASAGFMKPKRGDGRAVRSAPARLPRRADNQSHGAVTREELDATGWFIFSRWRKRKAKHLFAPAEYPKPSVRKRNPTSPQSDCTKRTLRSIENPCGLYLVCAHAQGGAVGQILDAPCQFEFEQRHPHRAPSVAARANSR
jgi:hypothetical protein